MKYGRGPPLASGRRGMGICTPHGWHKGVPTISQALIQRTASEIGRNIIKGSDYGRIITFITVSHPGSFFS